MYFQEYFTQITYNLAWLPLASIVTFAVAYSMGMGPLPWVMNTELFSIQSKATSSSLCASFNWLCSFLVVKFSPTLESMIGASGSYLSFAALAFLGTVLIGLTVPETKGKTAEQIQRHFKSRQAQRDIETEIKYLEDDGPMEASSSFVSSDKHSSS